MGGFAAYYETQKRPGDDNRGEQIHENTECKRQGKAFDEADPEAIAKDEQNGTCNEC